MPSYPKTLYVGGEPMVINSNEQELRVLDDALSLFQKQYGFRLFNKDGIEEPLTLRRKDYVYDKKEGLRKSIESTVRVS